MGRGGVRALKQQRERLRQRDDTQTKKNNAKKSMKKNWP